MTTHGSPRRQLTLCLSLAASTSIALGCEPPARGLATDTSLVVARIGEKDLALAFPLDSASAVRARESVGGEVALPETWYAQVLDAYHDTAVGEGVEDENRYEDWRLVALRVAPCAPIGTVPTDPTCWPEVRLVWQPVLTDITVHARFSSAFADDRAIHAIYDVPPEVATPAQAEEARALLLRVESGDGPLLSAAESELLARAAEAAARALLAGALALRGPGLAASEFAGHGPRPEAIGTDAESRALHDRLLNFLATFAPRRAIKTLTSFSLPEGREAAHTDEWVFVSFRGADGAISPEDIRLRSKLDGRTLFDFGASMTGSMTRDDPEIYDSQDGSSEAREIAEAVMLWDTDIARLTPRTRDRRETLVGNTSCASCHKMNALRFDLHNFSYLEDRELTVSPRVETDVAIDLEWIRSSLR